MLKSAQTWIVLVALSLVGSCSCPDRSTAGDGAGATAGKPPAKTTLVAQLEVEPAHLIYMLKPDAWAYRLTAHNVLEGLVRIDPRSYAYVGELASGWTVSDDGLTYEFALRRGVRWHDGKPFTAEDVKFTFDRMMDPKVEAAGTRASLEPFIDRYELVDASRFRIVCKRRSFYFLQALASLMILPAHLMKQGDLNRHPLLRAPVGTGPYRFAAWRSGEQIVLERFDGYWGKAPAIARVVWRVVRSPELALRLARRGELDFLPRVGPAQWDAFEQDAQLKRRFARLEHVTPGTAFVLINHQRPHLGDVKVRRALAQLLDVDTIIKRIMHGLAERVPSLYWKGDPVFDKTIRPPPFDPLAAVHLLHEAGYDDLDHDGVFERAGRPLSLTFLVPAGSRSARRWLTLYQQELKKAHVELKISALEWAAFLQRIREKRYDLAALGMQNAGPHTDLYLQLHSSQIADGQNYTAYSDPQVDRLLETLREELDPARRLTLAHQLQAKLAADMPLLPLFSLAEPGAVSRRVKGVYTSAVWYQIRDWRFE